MAAPSLFSGASIGDEASDLGLLWTEALRDYYHECNKDLTVGGASGFQIGKILADQEDQLRLFSQFRHDKSRVDRLRSLVSRNTAIIQTVATNISNAASTAFPPSAAILTAFNYVMSAAKAVSDDYDLVVQFFEIVHSFLDRVSMLEEKMPDLKQLQRFLVNVFKAILVLSAIATKYRMKEGRLKKWAVALIKGEDPKLRAAFDTLHAELQRFEQATMLATLRTTIDISGKADAHGRDLKAIQAATNQAIEIGQHGLFVGQQNLAQGEKTLTIASETYVAAVEGKGLMKDIASRNQEILDVVTRQDTNEAQQIAALRRLEHKFDHKGADQRSRGVEQTLDHGARKSTNLRLLEGLVYGADDTKDQSFMEIESTFVEGTFLWLRESPEFQDFEAGISPIVWLNGPSGIGKSYMMYAARRLLTEQFELDPNISVAYYSFREQDDDDLRVPPLEMLRSCAMQIAIQDTQYRDELLADLQRNREKFLNSEKLNVKKLWDRLFLSKITSASQRRVILLLDGVDEPAEHARAVILDVIKVFEEKGLNVHIMFSSDPEFIMEEDQKMIRKFEINKERVETDMNIICIARMKQLTRLRKLRSGTKTRIRRELCRQADSIRYIDHMLRRLNMIGREGAILKELKSLPKTTVELYEKLVDDCEKTRTQDELAVLKKFFAWVAYAKEQLSVGLAGKLLEYLTKGSANIDVDDEVEYKSARILRLSKSMWYDKLVNDISDNEEEEDENDAIREKNFEAYDDIDVLLGFQERSLRQYFRQKECGPWKLRTAPSLGHAIIFETVATVLLKSWIHDDDLPSRLLCTYCCQHWLKHWLEIKPEELSDDEASNVIQSLHAILSDRNQNFNSMTHPFSAIAVSIFGESETDHQRALTVLQEWGSVASRISAILPLGTVEWMRPFAHNPQIIYIRVAEAHVASWFLNRAGDSSSKRSFMLAHAALEKGRHLVRQQPELWGYFEEREKSKNYEITEKSILVISRSFWHMHMTMTAQCYRSIGLTMRQYDLLRPSLIQFELALKLADDDRDKLSVYSILGETMVLLAEEVKNKEKNTVRVGNLGGTELEKEKEIGAATVEMQKATDDSMQENLAHENTNQNDETGTETKEPDNDYTWQSWAEKATEVLSKGAALIQNIKVSESEEQDIEVKNTMIAIYSMAAKAELIRGKTENLISYLKDAMRIPTEYRETPVGSFVRELAGKEDWTTIIDMLKMMTKLEWLQVTLWGSDEETFALQKAGKLTGELEFITQLYEDSIKLYVSWGLVHLTPATLLKLADFNSYVIGGPEANQRAKRLLDKAMSVSTDSSVVSRASFTIANILMEEFRQNRNPREKILVQADMKELVGKIRDNMGREFDWTQSQTIIPLAYMTRKLAAVEFQKLLDDAFEGCVDLLQDSTTANDNKSLRMLARILAYVPGLYRDAQIAASCQLYIVDMNLYNRESAILLRDFDDDDDDILRSDSGDSNAVNETATTEIVVHEKAEIIKHEVKAQPKDMEADLDDLDGCITCAECRIDIRNWDDGKVFLCYYCTEIDLCEKCYNEKIARDKGELPPNWRTLCPKGHKHIEAPVEGWQGVRDGMLRFKDGVDMKFGTWLALLKGEKWPNAWEQFWSEEMRD